MLMKQIESRLKALEERQDLIAKTPTVKEEIRKQVEEDLKKDGFVKTSEDENSQTFEPEKQVEEKIERNLPNPEDLQEETQKFGMGVEGPMVPVPEQGTITNLSDDSLDLTDKKIEPLIKSDSKEIVSWEVECSNCGKKFESIKELEEGAKYLCKECSQPYAGKPNLGIQGN